MLIIETYSTNLILRGDKIIETNFSKKCAFARTKSVRCSAFFVLVCIYFGCLPVFGLQTVKSSGAIFCPLMKKWILRENYSRQPKKADLLADICAPKKIKTAFLEDAVKNFRVLPSALNLEQTEDLFFSYARKGECAFAEAGRSRGAPEQRFGQAAAGEKSLVNRQNDSGKTVVERFALKQLARPPTTTVVPLLYTLQNARQLRSISRRIRPRAPPFPFA